MAAKSANAEQKVVESSFCAAAEYLIIHFYAKRLFVAPTMDARSERFLSRMPDKAPASMFRAHTISDDNSGAPLSIAVDLQAACVRAKKGFFF